MTHRVQPTLPKIHGRGSAGLWLHVARNKARLPTPRLTLVPGPAAATFVADTSAGALLLHGPLVTYALRESFWGRRRSLGLWIERCVASNRDLQATLHDAWAIDAELEPGLTFPQGGGLLRAPSERDIFFYSRRGGRLLGSRIALSGNGSVSAGGRGPRGGRALLCWRYSEVTVDVFDPGREYDI